jgi:hypothetical protein
LVFNPLTPEKSGRIILDITGQRKKPQVRVYWMKQRIRDLILWISK